MVGRIMSRLSLVQRFMLLSLIILLAAGITVGWWMNNEITQGILHRTSVVSSLYVDAALEPHLQDLKAGQPLPQEHIEMLNALMQDIGPGDRIVMLKIWAPDGTVVYSTVPDLIGQRFPIKDELARSLAGEVTSDITDLSAEENIVERQQYSELLETYAPIHDWSTGAIIGASEFYQTTDDLNNQLAAAQRRTWLAVLVGATAIFGSLAGLVKTASDTIRGQQARLLQTVDELRALQSITDSALSALGTRDLLAALLERVCEAVVADAGAILLFDERRDLVTQAIRGAMLRSAGEDIPPVGYPAGWSSLILNSDGAAQVPDLENAPELADDHSRAHGLRSILGAPLRARGEVLGLAYVGTRTPRTYRPQEMRLLEVLCERAALFIQNRLLDERVRKAAARTAEINEKMLRRIGHDLHDGPAQDLSLALLRIDALRAPPGDGPSLRSGETADDFAIVKSALESSLREIRAISSGLRLPELQPLTLVEVAAKAVRDHERKTGSNVAFEADAACFEQNADAALCRSASLPVKITLYRVIQEALSNSYRHAPGASRHVHLWPEDDSVNLEVGDDGPGFDLAQLDGDADLPSGHLGMAGMRERIKVLGGTFHVSSSTQSGTQVQARIPLKGWEE
jgi:signal transduction histidine kinase